MRDRDRILEQLKTLDSHHKKARNLTWRMSFLTLLFGVMSLSILGMDLLQKSHINKSLSPRPQIQIKSFSDLIEGLENEPMANKQFELLEANLDFLPSNFSLNQLKGCIDLFKYQSYKLKVTRLLLPKVTDNYSDGEMEGFKKLFSSDGQSEVENLLSQRKNNKFLVP